MSKTITANRLVSTLNMPKDEWLKWRMKGLGGSDIAAAAGVSRYRDPYDLYLEKTGQYTPEFDDKSLERMDMGNEIEDFIATLFKKKHPDLRVENRNCIYQHHACLWALVNLDRVAFDPAKKSWGVVEIKNVGEWAATKTWDESGDIPLEVMCQVQHQLFVTGLEWAYQPALMGGNRYREHYIVRDEDFINDLETAGGDLWSKIESRTEPAAGPTEGSLKALKGFARFEESVCDLSLDVELVNDYMSAQIAAKAAKKLKDALKHQILQRMGDSVYAKFNDAPAFQFKEQAGRMSVNTSLLESRYPEAFAEVVKYGNPFRKFDVKLKEKEYE